jgi:DNA replication protein DnaC
LLILDELGDVPASKAGAELPFDVIGTAYERTSIILTTNLPLAARLELVALGWIQPETTDTWAERRWGRAYRIDLAWN